MKKIIKKKMSIEDLAFSMNKGFGRVNKKIDNVIDLVDKLAISTTKGFESVDKRFDETKEDIKGVKNQMEGTNNRIDEMSLNRVKYKDYNKLKVRVNFIEKKLQINSTVK